MQEFPSECFAPVTEAVWLAAVADVMAAGPGFVEEAFVTCGGAKLKFLTLEELQLLQR